MIHEILKFVAHKYKISEDVILKKTKKRESREPRQLCMYLAKRHTTLTLTDIGEEYGGKDHATVLHSLKVIENEIPINKFFLEVVSEFDAYARSITQDVVPTIQDVIDRLEECSNAFTHRKNFYEQAGQNHILIEKLKTMTYVTK